MGQEYGHENLFYFQLTLIFDITIQVKSFNLEEYNLNNKCSPWLNFCYFNQSNVRCDLRSLIERTTSLSPPKKSKRKTS